MLDKKTFMDKISLIVGDKNDDETLEIISELSDNYDDVLNTIGEDWKTKFDENDKMWREKYRKRFFDGTEKNDKEEPDNYEEKETKKKITSYEDLFETKG